MTTLLPNLRALHSVHRDVQALSVALEAFQHCQFKSNIFTGAAELFGNINENRTWFTCFLDK